MENNNENKNNINNTTKETPITSQITSYLDELQYIWASQNQLTQMLLISFLKKYAKKYTIEDMDQRNFMKNIILGTSLVGHIGSALLLGSNLSFFVGGAFNPIRDIKLLMGVSALFLGSSMVPITYYAPQIVNLYNMSQHKSEETVDLYADSQLDSAQIYYIKNFL